MRSLAEFWKLLGKAVWRAYDRNCGSTAKAAAYSGLLALFPVLAALTAVLVQMRANEIVGVISANLSEVLPPGTEQMIFDQFVIKGEKPIGILIVAVVLAAWAASGFMSSLVDGFNQVYGVEGRPWARQIGASFALVFACALPVIGASALILFGERIQRSIAWEPLAGGVALLFRFARIFIALGGMVLVTGLLYYWGPNRKQSWRNVWPGAWIATVLWLTATAAFGWYVQNIAGYNVMYGSIGTVIALLVWIYLLAFIACAGCAFNAVREK
ncbi:MAG: YihY/virulence factor BrkB family protein [Bryobacteraceae bacterium]